jgi:hypothetical protein
MLNSDLSKILRSTQTVFTFKDLLLQQENPDAKLLKRRLNYYVKTGQLLAVRKGIYTKDENYDRYELATKILRPAYISFETVTGASGLTFQYYGQIFVASGQSKEFTCDGQKYVFRKLKSTILTDPSGIENRETYSIATPERAFLDVLYLSKDYYFDNLSPLNWEKIHEILPIYGGNKRMAKLVKEAEAQAKADQ